MIKFTVKHSCGHDAPHGFSGTESERKRREDWLRQQPCQACWRAGESDAASAQAGKWNLPTLDGKEDDKAWAEVIRQKAFAHNKDFHARVTDSRKFGPNDELMKHTVVTAADEALKELGQQRDAAWWIANRFEVLSYVKQRVVAAVAPILDGRAS